MWFREVLVGHTAANDEIRPKSRSRPRHSKRLLSLFSALGRRARTGPNASQTLWSSLGSRNGCTLLQLLLPRPKELSDQALAAAPRGGVVTRRGRVAAAHIAP